MRIAPPEAQQARVPVKVVSKDPVEGGKTSGKPPVLPKSYNKRPVAPASGDKVAAEKRTKTSTEDDRPGKKQPSCPKLWSPLGLPVRLLT